MPRPQAAESRAGRSRILEVDCQIATRMRERRMMLGMTQQQLAELMGVTYQQVHKYESGSNRISAGRLLEIARALQVEVGYLFENTGTGEPEPTPQRRAMLELARNFVRIRSVAQQAALCAIVRAVAGAEPVAADEQEAGR